MTLSTGAVVMNAEEVKEVKTMKEGNVVIAAKNAAERAMKIWADLYDRMNCVSQADGRKHTQRKHHEHIANKDRK